MLLEVLCLEIATPMSPPIPGNSRWPWLDFAEKRFIRFSESVCIQPYYMFMWCCVLTLW